MKLASIADVSLLLGVATLEGPCGYSVSGTGAAAAFVVSACLLFLISVQTVVGSVVDCTTGSSPLLFAILQAFFRGSRNGFLLVDWGRFVVFPVEV